MPPLGFLLVVTSLVTLCHVYIAWRLLPVIPVFMVLPGAIWLIASIILVPLGLLARGIRQRTLGDAIAWLGLLAMGFFSSLLVLTFARDVVTLLLWPFGLSDAPFRVGSALFVPAAAALVTMIGFFNARRVARIVEVEVPLRDLPAGLAGFSIVQISDVHVGPTIKRTYVERIVERVNGLNADVIAVTGDLVDGRVSELGEHTAPLARLRSHHGSFFVTGNHEYYSGAHEWIAELRRLGMRVLMNEHVVLTHADAQIVLAGVPDYSAGQFDPAHRSDPVRALAGAPEGCIKVLLAHQPRTATPAERAGFDLQLSGHTHGGQFFPWNFFVPLQQPYTAGLHRLHGMWIYVSRGTGYWGPPKRFFAPSEITRLRLVPAEKGTL